jgi:hypothetical protein
MFARAEHTWWTHYRQAACTVGHGRIDPRTRMPRPDRGVAFTFHPASARQNLTNQTMSDCYSSQAVAQKAAYSVPDVKQVGVLPRLRALILLGRPHACAEVRGRMPGPARIEEDRARQRDQIGVPG